MKLAKISQVVDRECRWAWQVFLSWLILGNFQL